MTAEASGAGDPTSTRDGARRGLRRLLVPAGLALVTLIAVRVLASRGQAAAALAVLPAWWALAVALVANVLANGVLAASWGRLLALLGERRPPLTTAWWLWASTQLTRYGLGGAQVVSRAVAVRTLGIPASVGGLTVVLETTLQLCLNVAVVLLTLPVLLGAADVGRLVAVTVVPLLVLLAVSLQPRRLVLLARAALARLPVPDRARRRLGELGVPPRLPLGGVTILLGWYAVNLALRLGAFLLLLTTVAPAGVDARLLAIAAGAASLGTLAGRLALFVPGGIGPREGATLLLLGPALGALPAVGLVASVRLVEIAAELAFVGVAALGRRRIPPSPASSDGATARVDAPRAR